MALAFLVGRRLWPRFAVPAVLAAGIALAAAQGRMRWPACNGAGPPGLDDAGVQRSPRRSAWALPLFIVTMASQNLPGVAAQRAAG